MVSHLREIFNQNYSNDKYQNFLEFLEKTYHTTVAFKLSESPVFISIDFQKKLTDVCESILDQLENMDYNVADEHLIPNKWLVANRNNRPEILCIDFGICKNTNGEIEPQLIELQAFPSLFYFQEFLGKSIPTCFPNFPENVTFLPNGTDREHYLEDYKQLVLGDYDPKHVILMDLYPDKQKTKIDFLATKEAIGIEPVCYTKIFQEGKQLYYWKNEEKISINRIYNRLIMDELDRMPDVHPNFDITADLDVEWIVHPNWFFLISKQILPKLHHPYIPKSYFVPAFPSDENLEDYVLKPLYSFAGKGINLNPNKEDIQQLEHPEHYILQKKVTYEPIIKDVNGDFSKAEIRMFYTLNKGAKRPTACINLVRLSKGMMINVDHNKDVIWTGPSIAFFEQEN